MLLVYVVVCGVVGVLFVVVGVFVRCVLFVVLSLCVVRCSVFGC